MQIVDLQALGWSICPLGRDLSPLVDPSPLVARRLVEIPEAPAYGVVTGPISGVWAGPADGAPAVVANDGRVWGLWPTRPAGRRARPAGEVVPVWGVGVRWVSGAPNALVGTDLQRKLVSMAGGDPTAARDIATLAAKGAGLVVAPDVSGSSTWQPASWPTDPDPIPWGDVMPSELSYVCRALTGYCGAPETLTGLISTGFAAAALVARVQVEMHTRDGLLWAEKHPGLYALAVAGSSRMKSPIFDPLLEPWIARAGKVFSEDCSKHSDWKARTEAAKAILQGRQTPIDEREEAAREAAEPEPIERKLFVADITPARFVERCSLQPSLHLFSQEADTFFSRCIMDKNADIAGLLHAYAGEAHGGTDRVGRKVRVVPGAKLRATMVGSLQPKIFGEIGQHPKFLEQGLMGRIIYSKAAEAADPGGGKALPAGFAGHWAALLGRLWALPEVPRDATGQDTGRPRGILVSPRSTQALLDLRERLWARSQLGGDLYLLQSWAGKAHGQAARLACTWALCADPSTGSIPDSLIADAIELTERHLLRHAVAAWDLFYWPPGSDLARQIWERCAAADLRIWRREDLDRAAGAVSLSPDALASALTLLEKRGFLRRAEGSRSLYLPNPLALGSPTC